MKKQIELPREYVNVMITYKGKVRVRDKYYDHYENQVVTRRAFYSKSDGFYNHQDEWIETPEGYFSVPQYWTTWSNSDGTESIVPEGFWHYARVYPKDIIKIEPNQPLN